MGVINLGQVAALIHSVRVETLPEGAAPTVRNDGTKANAELVFGIPDTRNMIINILKNGYIQWPGMPSPLEDTSLHFEGYSWYEVNYGGNFFRAKGRNAKAFSAKKLTKEQIKDGAYVFQDDEQGDAIRNIMGTLGLFYSEIFGYCDGAFETVYRWPGQYSNRSVTGSNSNIGTIVFNAEKAKGVTTAEENRARNLTFTIWVLVKD